MFVRLLKLLSNLLLVGIVLILLLDSFGYLDVKEAIEANIHPFILLGLTIILAAATHIAIEKSKKDKQKDSKVYKLGPV